MTDYKFCDIHSTEEGRRQPKESMRTVVIQQWQKVDGANKLFENKLDACLDCLGKQIVSRAVGLKIDYERNWKTDVWQTGKNGKKFKQAMSLDELRQYLKEEESKAELAELKLRASGR